MNRHRLTYWLKRLRRSLFGGSGDETSVSYESRRRGHEPEDYIQTGAIVAFGVGVLAMIFIVLWMLTGFFEWISRESPPPAAPHAEYHATPDQPRLQHAPVLELNEVRERERLLLDDYGWIDRAQGVVRIPIARAMELTAERGLPVDTAVRPPDTARVITSSGYAPYQAGPPKPTAPAYLGPQSPEPYVPAPYVGQALEAPDTTQARLSDTTQVEVTE